MASTLGSWNPSFPASPPTRASAAAGPASGGTRIRVADVLQLFAAGLTAEQILAEMPGLEALDLQAALQPRK